MILYFSGTGNSAYVAKRIATHTSDEIINLFDKIKNNDYTPLTSEKPWVIVVPTYAWQIPHIVRDWLLKTRLKGNRKIYFVMTCGGGIGAARNSLRKLCKKKSMHFRGCTGIVMPENYIVMFSAPDQEESKKIIYNSNPIIKEAAETIAAGKYLHGKIINPLDHFLSGPVNKGFNRHYINAKKFYAKDSCVSCGKCEDVCPLNNISIYKGKPIWGSDCTHCMACICNCPTEAIEYGRISYGKNRYTCPF